MIFNQIFSNIMHDFLIAGLPFKKLDANAMLGNRRILDNMSCNLALNNYDGIW